MSSRSDLEVIGAPLKLCVVSDSLLLFSVFSSLCCMLLCVLRQRLNLVNPTASMRLRSKRLVGFGFGYFIFS